MPRSKFLVGLAGIHQRQNANLAVYLAKEFLKSRGTNVDMNLLPEAFLLGLKETRWPGRCQTVPDPIRQNTTWYLDGAHTIESLECCAEWFVSPGVGTDSGTSSYAIPAAQHCPWS